MNLSLSFKILIKFVKLRCKFIITYEYPKFCPKPLITEHGLLHLRSFECICEEEQNAHLYQLERDGRGRDRLQMEKGEKGGCGNKLVWGSTATYV